MLGRMAATIVLDMLQAKIHGMRQARHAPHDFNAADTPGDLEEIQQQIDQLKTGEGVDREAHQRIQHLQQEVLELRKQFDPEFTAWRKTALARHPQRPYMLDYVERIFTGWSEIHGDRAYADDHALICGMARFHGEEVAVIGHQKGRDTKSKVYRNFGMPNPEGYRKALRVMHLAQKFGRPIFTFVDTPGAYPGLGAEERGQAEAIARNLREMSMLEVPVIATITGEGGSGGALAVAVADRVLMLENSIYSVISPEGCASIMWRDSSKKEVAAQALHITAADLVELGCIDGVVPEPEGGAHKDVNAAAALLDDALKLHYSQLKSISAADRMELRYRKFRDIAQFFMTK